MLGSIVESNGRKSKATGIVIAAAVNVALSKSIVLGGCAAIFGNLIWESNYQGSRHSSSDRKYLTSIKSEISSLR